MKWLRVIIAIACFGPVVHAHAEWTSVGKFDRGEFFIDRSTIVSKGAQREVWSVMNYRSPQMDSKGHVFRSTRSLLQVHCETRHARAIHSSFHTGDMLRGTEVYRMGTLPDWEAVPDGSPMQRILDLVCRA